MAFLAPRPDVIETGRKRAMCSMINSERFSDVTFMVEGQKVCGHRAILAAYSDYLDKQFCGPYLDSTGIVPIEDIRHDPFVNVVLPYIYTGELAVPDDEDLMSVLEHADRWQLDDLTKFVAAHICESNHLDGHICMQALNFAKHHCKFDGLLIESDSPELWSSMYSECLKYFEKHGTDLIKLDPSVLTHIESDDLMYIVLSRIDMESMSSQTLLELGRVFLSWLKGESKEGTPIETLFEVLAHMKTMCDVEHGSRTSAILKVNALDIASPSWRCPSETLRLPGFTNKVHVQKSANSKHLGVFFTQTTECEFLNRWPVRTRITVHLEPTARRTSRASKDFSCEFTKQWRDTEQGQGFPDFAPLLDLKPEGKYLHDGCIHLHVNMSFEPHPILRLCMLFASCGFQQIRSHPKLSMIDSSLLKNVLTCDHLDATSESEVLEVVTSHASHYPLLAASMLECVRFAFVPVPAVAHAFRNSAVFRGSDHFKKRVMASLRSTEDGVVSGRKSYAKEDRDVQLTLEALVDAVLSGNVMCCFSKVDEGVSSDCVESSILADMLPCQCATHNRALQDCSTSSPCTTNLAELDEEEDEETLSV
jgi:hypothetical protein